MNPDTRLSIRHLDVLCRALNGYCYTKSNGDFVFNPLKPNERFVFKSKQEALKVLLALINQQAILPDRVLRATTARTNKTCFIWKA